ncbi:MAG: GIY-YIG nuclease family protein [Candidatus Taylorbacteria bacterium]|nr:GIY-YIG nuclease family protein [Candidatus Taylorbacteria bacterium]
MRRQDFRNSQLPDAPGVYFFLGKNRKILYVGRATSLRDRVKSYFSADLAERRGPQISDMVGRALSVDFKKTNSVLEAILLEADLIKKFQPPYNVKEKDDKSFNCVVITNEDFPRVLLVRKKDLDFSSLQTTNYKPQSVFGPFPHGSRLRAALKIIRKIFPFRDRCNPPTLYSNVLKNTSMENNMIISKSNMSCSLVRKDKPCFNRQIGLCPGVCTGEITKTDYARTIRHIKFLFNGEKKQILKNLESEMKAAAEARDFERAGAIKKTLFALRHIQDIALLGSNAADERGLERRLTRIESTHLSSASIRATIRVHPHLRIEAYDIAHISGTDVVGAMVLIEDGAPKKSGYRKFKIRGGFGNNDLTSLKEVIERRLNHPEWPLPALFVADGGLAQQRIIEAALKARGLSIPVAAVVKNERHRPEKVLGDEALVRAHEKSILLANSEAHRFAISFHRKVRDRIF